MYELVVIPCIVEIGVGRSGNKGHEFVIIPRISKTHTTDEVEVDRINMVLLHDDVRQVEHQVQIRSSVVVLISLAQTLQAALAFPAADIETGSYRRSKHATDGHGTDGSNQLGSIVIGERYLATALQGYEGIGIGLIVQITVILC